MGFRSGVLCEFWAVLLFAFALYNLKSSGHEGFEFMLSGLYKLYRFRSGVLGGFWAGSKGVYKLYRV